MTGGQMAPTTLPGQKTTTTPRGRKPVGDGFPMKISEMVSLLEGTAYVERVACHTPAHVRKARKAVFRAFEMQMQGKGFSMVEFVSACPTNWRLSPVEAAERIEQQSLKEYPLGVFKEPTGDR